VDLHYTSLVDLSVAIRAGAVSPVAVTEAILGRIQDHNGTYLSYATVTADRALARAEQAEREVATGLWRGPLHGVPIAVKDLCDTTFAPTAAGMHIHRDRRPEVNATAVDRLERAGAVILGKLSMTEGAFGAHHPKMPKPKNPWNTDYWTGVSSSGSGAATAAGLCFGSLGSDTAGSIRLPTNACGLSGMKATWGRVSRYGVCDLAQSLDHLGPMTRTVADSAAILHAIAGADPHDPTAARVPVPDYLALIGGGIRGLRIGLCDSYVFGATDREIAAVIRDALEVFEALGAEVVPLQFPDVSKLAAPFLDIFAAETAIAHEATYPARKAEYGPELAGFLDSGRAVTGMQLGKAYIHRDAFKGEMQALLGSVDAIICPVIPSKLPTAAEWDAAMGSGAFGPFLTFTLPFSYAGSPSLIMQGGFDGNGLPVGFQLIGKHFNEELLFRVGHSFQSVTDWHTRHPGLSATR